MRNFFLFITLTFAFLTVPSCDVLPDKPEGSDSFSWELILEQPSSVPIGLQIWQYADFYSDGTFVLSKEYLYSSTDTETFQYTDSGNIIRIHNMYGKDWVGTMPSDAIRVGEKVQFKEDGAGSGYFALKYLGN
jgi:hypothetical protein